MNTMDKNILIVIKDHSGYGQNNRTANTPKECIAIVKKIVSLCNQLGLPSKQILRSELRKVRQAELVIIVGGDGTFLDAARYIKGIPMIGINPFPDSSEGFYTIKKYQRFEYILNNIFSGTENELVIQRLDIILNGKSITYPVLNDILISHKVPALMTRFIMKYQAKEYYFKCSGVWVSTPSGSTGANKSAGGKMIELDAQQFQFVVREPYTGTLTKEQISNGILDKTEFLTITSKMDNGKIFLDGALTNYNVHFDDEIQIRISRHSLSVYGLTRNRTEEFYKLCN